MSFRNVLLLSCFALSLCLHPAWAQQDKAQAKTLVVIFGEPLTAEDLMPAQEELDMLREKAQDNFNALLNYRIQIAAFDTVIERVLRDYAKRKNITADEALVAKFEDKFGSEFTASQTSANEESEKVASSKTIADIAQLEVLKFMVEKAMFNEFGGRVVFKQSNPLMPVDAYRSLLKQYKDSGQLTFENKALEEDFWKGFSEPFKFEVPPENISFEQPWWL